MVASLFLLCTGLLAQGSDCSSPEAIQGVVTQWIDSQGLGATTFGQGTACDWMGLSRSHEAFYQWTAQADGDYIVELWGVDYAGGLALYQGFQCTATCVGSVAAQGHGETIRWELDSVQAGSQYLIHCVSLSGSGGIGVLSLEPNSCHPASAYDDAFEPNDSCLQAATLAPGSYGDLWVSNFAPDVYRVDVPALHGVGILGLPIGHSVTLESGTACQGLVGGQGPIQWQNLSLDPQPYWVRVAPQEGVECANYDLSVVTYPIDCDVPLGGDGMLEPNDRCEQALLIPPGSYPGLWASVDEPDFYAVDVPPGFGLYLEGAAANPGLTLGVVGQDCSAQGFIGLPAPRLGFGPINTSDQIQRYVFSAGFVPELGWRQCGTYEMVVSWYRQPCEGEQDDVFDRPGSGGATQQALTDGEYTGLTLRPTGDSYLVCVPAGGSVVVDFETQVPFGEVIAVLCRSVDWPHCLVGGDSARGRQFQLQYQNSGSQAERLAFSFRQAQPSPECMPYRMTISGSGGCLDFVKASSFCFPGNPNPHGESTTLMASQEWLFGMQVKWEAVGGPAGAFGYLVGGPEFVEPGIPLGLGQLCVQPSATQGLLRYNRSGTVFDSLGQFDALGRFMNAAQTSDTTFGYLLPRATPWGDPFTMGESRTFQLWHRTPGGGTNLSNGIQLTF